MPRNAHMVDLLRSELSYDSQLRNFLAKSELTREDFDLIIEKAELVKEAAKQVRKQKFGT